MSEDLRALFPAAYQPREMVRRNIDGNSNMANVAKATGPRPLGTRALAILALELRGADKNDIARRMGVSATYVRRLTNTDRYRQHRDEKLDRLNSEFLALKPLAFTAVRNGLTDADPNTALRASEQWMKAAGFMHYGSRGAVQGGGPVSAEDVAAQLLAQVNVQVNVQLPTSEARGEHNHRAELDDGKGKDGPAGQRNGGAGHGGAGEPPCVDPV